MGWTGHSLGDKWVLYTRGGLRGVFVTDGEVEVKIPADLLMGLAADQILSNKIGALEQLSEAEALVAFGLERRKDA